MIITMAAMTAIQAAVVGEMVVAEAANEEFFAETFGRPFKAFVCIWINLDPRME